MNRLKRLSASESWNKKAQCWVLLDHAGDEVGLLERDRPPWRGPWKLYAGVGWKSRFVGAYEGSQQNAAAVLERRLGLVEPAMAAGKKPEKR